MKLAGIELKCRVALVIALTVLVGTSAVAWTAAGQADPVNSATNRVLSLDGKTAFMRVADSGSLHSVSNALTLELWFKAASFPTGQGDVSSLIRKNINEGQENFFLRFRSIDGRPWIEMTPGLQIGVLRASYEFAPDRWYHLAGTYNGTEMAVFVNGTQVKSEPFSGTMSIDDSETIVGKGDPEWSSGEFFHGAVDEIRIWRVARSSKEIQADMSGKSAGNDPGLIAYWNFDTGTASDLSTNRNDGHLEGKAQVILAR